MKNFERYNKLTKEKYNKKGLSYFVMRKRADSIICPYLESINNESVLEVGIGYGSVNHPVDRDPCCGYTGIIDNECPQCHRKEEEVDGGFERIRRITGYLVGAMDKWNDAKTAEEKDRVKHSIGSGMEKL